MIRPTTMDKDRLAAFVDGEMSPEEAAALVMHLADHPQDQAYVDDLMTANEALAKAFAAPMQEPVPPILRDLIMGNDALATSAQVLPFRAKPRNRSGFAAWGAMAAGGALAAGVALVTLLPAVGGLDPVPGPLAAGSPLTEALAALPSGAVSTLSDGTELMVLSSLPTPDGYCREIEVISHKAQSLQVALACNDGAGWIVEVVIAENLSDAAAAEGFGTASGDEAQGFTPFLDRIGAGAILDPEEEAAAIARAWAK